MIEDLTLQPIAPSQAATDLLVVPVTPTGLSLNTIPELRQPSHGALVQEIERRRFKANAGSFLLLPSYGSLPAKNLLLYGLGDEPSLQDWRLLGDQAGLSARAVCASHFVINTETAQASHLQAIVEGLELGSYSFSNTKAVARIRISPARPSSLAPFLTPITGAPSLTVGGPPPRPAWLAT